MNNTIKIYTINNTLKPFYDIEEAITFEGETLEDFYNYLIKNIKNYNLTDFSIDYPYYMIKNFEIFGVIYIYKGYFYTRKCNKDEIKMIKDVLKYIKD